jgi:hypothetical protein
MKAQSFLPSTSLMHIPCQKEEPLYKLRFFSSFFPASGIPALCLLFRSLPETGKENYERAYFLWERFEAQFMPLARS